MSGGLTRRMVIASGLLTLLVGAAFAVLYLAIAATRDSQLQARQARVELAAADQLEKLLIDLETGVRGFVITGEERFLEPWKVARTAVPAAGRRLSQLADDPGQAARAEQIVRAIRSYINEYSIPVVSAVRRDPAPARSIAVTAEGKQRVDSLRAQFARFTAVERALLNDRQAESDADARRAIVAATAGLIGSVLLIVLFTIYVARGIVRPVNRAAGLAGRLAAGDLSARMPETGAAEIGELERSFNTMASSLEESRGELIASRARVVAAADETRRRIERDLHDGAQQRLVSLALELRGAEAGVPTELDEVRTQLSRTARGLSEVLQDLQEISRGIHPAILSKGGVESALKALARRSAVPVELDVRAGSGLPAPVEVALYYIVSEALTNAAKHADASVVHVDVEASDGIVRLSIRDDGIGGADPRRGGSGLVGLRDRVEALGGKIEIASPVGSGTTMHVTLPVDLG